MSDETRLPKWAQALLEAERTRAALSWPTEAEPLPVCVGNDATGEVTGDRSDADLWSMNAYTRTVKPAYLRKGFCYNEPLQGGYRGIGSRLSGPLYATEREAFIALRWAVARRCAAELRSVDEAIAKAERQP